MKRNWRALAPLLCRALLCIFIFAGDALGCQTDLSQMVALDVIPLWLLAVILIACPLLVLARLKWGHSPWDTQSRKSSEQTQERNE